MHGGLCFKLDGSGTILMRCH